MDNIVEKVKGPTGHLHLEISRFGQLIEVVDEKNLIVDNSKQLLASLLGGTTANKFITKVGFGTNSAAALPGNTALTGPVYKNVSSVTFPTPGQVRFNFALTSAEGNGTSIIEFGLLTADNNLFSRRVRSSPIVKDNTLSFTGSWTITF